MAFIIVRSCYLMSIHTHRDFIHAHEHEMFATVLQFPSQWDDVEVKEAKFPIVPAERRISMRSTIEVGFVQFSE